MNGTNDTDDGQTQKHPVPRRDDEDDGDGGQEHPQPKPDDG